jgi:hypothetical protein
VLNRRGAEFVGQGLEHGFAGDAVVRENTHLDQAMGVERAIDFFFDIDRQAVVSDHDYGVKVVRIGAVNFALGRGKLY